MATSKERDIAVVFYEQGFMLGRMLSHSKLAYRQEYPDRLVVFNANIVTKKHGKVWYGDIDTVQDEDKLNKIAKILKEDIYVLFEMDCRFDTEQDPIDKLISKALWSTKLYA